MRNFPEYLQSCLAVSHFRVTFRKENACNIILFILPIWSTSKIDILSPPAQIKRMFQEGKLEEGDKKTIKEFSGKYTVWEKLVADYTEHLTDIEMREGKWWTANDRKCAERKQQEYNENHVLRHYMYVEM